MSATATRGGRGRVNAAVKFVLRSVADEILIVLTQSHLVLLAAVRVVRIRRRAVASPHPPHLERPGTLISKLRNLRLGLRSRSPPRGLIRFRSTGQKLREKGSECRYLGRF